MNELVFLEVMANNDFMFRMPEARYLQVFNIISFHLCHNT